MGPLHVLFTMDCERIRAESPPGGPESWELSERAIRGFCELLLRHGYAPTLFLTPECAQEHADLLGRLAERGVELGLHIHPQSLADRRYLGYLGEYTAAMQGEIVGLGLQIAERALGMRPVSFRPGNFSANKATYTVLYDLGFRQGSVSDPGRYAPGFAADWLGAYPDPHYVDPEDKLGLGRLGFLEVPVTTDPERRQPNGFPYELRIESGTFADWHRPILNKTLARLEEEATAFRAFCLFTHNTFPYDDGNDPRSRTLLDILRYLTDLQEERVEVIPATLEEAHERFLA